MGRHVVRHVGIHVDRHVDRYVGMHVGRHRADTWACTWVDTGQTRGHTCGQTCGQTLGHTRGQMCGKTCGGKGQSFRFRDHSPGDSPNHLPASSSGTVLWYQIRSLLGSRSRSVWNRESQGMVHEDYWVLRRTSRSCRFQGMQTQLEEVLEVTD